MRQTLLAAGLLAIAGSAICSGPAAAAANDCDRACLNGFVDQYMAALLAHDPKRLPVTQNVRFTENGQTIALGDALWHNAAGPISYKLYFNEVEKGQTGFIGLLREAENPVILFLRLKVADRKISEVETIVARSDPASGRTLKMQERPILSQVVPAGQRTARAALLQTLDDYLEAVSKSKPNDAIFHPQCQRIENGNITAGNPDGDKLYKMSCGAQLWTGVSGLLTGYREPRPFVVDEERGLVGVFFFFDHSSPVKTITIKYPDGTTAERKSGSPYSWMAGELFKIENGKVRQIEIVITRVPYGMPSGWSNVQ